MKIATSSSKCAMASKHEERDIPLCQKGGRLHSWHGAVLATSSPMSTSHHLLRKHSSNSYASQSTPAKTNHVQNHQHSLTQLIRGRIIRSGLELRAVNPNSEVTLSEAGGIEGCKTLIEESHFQKQVELRAGNPDSGVSLSEADGTIESWKP